MSVGIPGGTGSGATQGLPALLDAVAHGVVVQARDGRILLGNAAAQEILGLSEEQLLGRRSSDPRWRAVREDGSDLPGDEHPAMVALRTGRPVRDFLMGLDSPGRGRRWISVTAHLVHAPGPDDDAAAVVATFVDVTSLQEAQEALRASEQHFRLLAEHSGDVILRTSQDGTILYASESMETVFGWRAAQLIGGVMHGATLEEDREVLVEGHAQALAGHDDVRRTVRAFRADGQMVWVEAIMNPVRDAGGDVREVQSSIRDVTLQVRREQQEAALRRLAEVVSAGGEPGVVVEAIAEEAGRLLQADSAAVLRFEGAETVAAATWSEAGTAPVGAMARLVARVRSTGRMQRIAPGSGGAGAAGPAEAIACPVRAEGRLWGCVWVARDGGTAPFTADAEAWLDHFTGLAAASVDAAETRARLVRRAEIEERFRSALGGSPISVFMLDSSLGYVWLFNPHETAGSAPGAFDLDERARDTAQRVMETGIGERFEQSPVLSGRQVVLDVRFEPVAGADGTGIVGTATDITGLRVAQQALTQSEERYRLIVETAREGIVTVDAEGRVTFATPRSAELLGAGGPEDLVGRPLAEMLSLGGTGARPGAPVPPVEARFTTPAWRLTESRVVLPDGTARWLAASRSPMADERGAFSGGLVMLTDVTAWRDQTLADARLAAIVESSGDAIVSVDAQGVIDSWNAGAERLYGPSAADAIGRELGEVVGLDPAEAAERTARIIAAGRTEVYETRDARLDGDAVDVLVSASPIHDDDGRVVGVARIARDITRQKRGEERLRYLAEHDPLTGLLNRRRLAEEVNRITAEARRYGTKGALLIADLDDFKVINDSLGHQAGDEFIIGVARLLAAQLRDTDVLARLGGDEFAVVLSHTGLDDAARVAEKLRRAVAAYEPTIAGRRLHSTLSIGVAQVDDAFVVEADEAMAAADVAMYEAKARGRNQVALVRAGTAASREQARAALNWSGRLRAALAEGRFELYGQPIVDLRADDAVRRELLLRLREGGRLISPGAFIPTAERYGLIGEIDRFVIGRALELLAEGETQGAINVNLSGRSMGDPYLPGIIERELARHGVDPTRLAFEVTETAAIADITAADRLISALHDLGCDVGLDDFGSGFASFSYLKRLRVRFLKIDGAYVHHIARDTDDRRLVQAMVEVAHGLGKWTVAEHVETAETLEVLRELGVDMAQGFHLGRPGPLPEVGPSAFPAAPGGSRETGDEPPTTAR